VYATELQRLFEEFDADHNGILDKSEFLTLCRSLNPSLSEGEVEDIFCKLDYDSTGSIE